MSAAPLRALAGGEVMARFFGTSPPGVLALHGWGRDGTDFIETLRGVAAVAPDLAGFGNSPPPAGVWGAADYARHLEPVLAEMSTPAVVLGHSFGGRVAVCLAAGRPELVAGLVLTGAPLIRTAPPARPRLPYRLLRWANRRGLVSEARMDRLRKRHGSADYRQARGMMRQVLVKVVNESYEDQLDMLSVPIDLVWGQDDTEVPVERARAAYRRLREAGCPVRLEVIPETGHNLPLRRPRILADSVRRMQENTRR